MSFVRACNALGFTSYNDKNNPKNPNFGVFDLQATMDKRGRRHNTYRAFLPRQFLVAHQDNLHICTKAIATSVMFDKSGPTPQAVGVALTSAHRKSDIVRVRAKYEVILCAGALRSPQLLMLRSAPNLHRRQL